MRKSTEKASVWWKAFIFKFAEVNSSLERSVNTEFIIAGSKARIINLQEILEISSQGSYVKFLCTFTRIYGSYVKFLRFVVDETFDWEEHIKNIPTKANSGLAVLRSRKMYSLENTSFLYRTVIVLLFGTVL